MDLSPISMFSRPDSQAMASNSHPIQRHEIDVLGPSPTPLSPYTPPRYIDHTSDNYHDQLAFNVARIQSRRPIFDNLLSTGAVLPWQYDLLNSIDPTRTTERTTLIIALYARHKLTAAEYNLIK